MIVSLNLFFDNWTRVKSSCVWLPLHKIWRTMFGSKTDFLELQSKLRKDVKEWDKTHFPPCSALYVSPSIPKDFDISHLVRLWFWFDDDWCKHCNLIEISILWNSTWNSTKLILVDVLNSLSFMKNKEQILVAPKVQHQRRHESFELKVSICHEIDTLFKVHHLRNNYNLFNVITPSHSFIFAKKLFGGIKMHINNILLQVQYLQFIR